MSDKPLRLGTRASKLARWQADWTSARLVELGVPVKIVEIATIGDTNQSHDVASIGSVGLFTKEIQRALLDEVVDVAVHSLKDLPTTMVPGLGLAAVPTRADASDVLVAHGVENFDQLPHGARVGTGSLRRRSQLLRLRPDLEVLPIRGNVDTRLRKLDEGQYDAIVLAAAGLTRLGLSDRVALPFTFDQMLPAPGQGALGIECRAGDERVLASLAPLNDPDARAAVVAERAMLARVEGGCLAAIGAHGRVVGDTLQLTAVILSDDGTIRLVSEVSGTTDEAEAIGIRAGDELLSQGAAQLVHERR